MSWLGVVDGLLTLLALTALVPAAVLGLELFAAATRSRRSGFDSAAPGGDRGDAPSASAGRDPAWPLAVLMPAHDEAGGIPIAIAAVLAQLAPGDRLLVVADNCTDATAAVARAAGAEVIERFEPDRRGKGYALDFGVRHLAARPPAVVIIVDADCQVAPGALSRLVGVCAETGRPTQALYLMRNPLPASLRMRIAEFAWLVRNQSRPLGAGRFGWPCQLMGTGMAFPWPLIREAPLASGHLVEDMQLGLDLAARGRAPVFCPEALVTSQFPSDATASVSQRTRWEHGHLGVIAAVGPRLLWRAIATRNAVLFAMVLDLMVPPLAALVMGTVLLLALNAVWWLVSGTATPALLSLAALLLIVSGILAAWARDARGIVAWREMLGIPWYIVAKLPVYARLLTRRQLEWVRTGRDEKPH